MTTSENRSTNTPIHEVDWEQLIPPDQWAVYRLVLDGVQSEGIQFALGGGLAVGVYSGQLRNTKDIDLYILPSDRDRVVRVMTKCGLGDYFDKLPYDRGWIYRGNKDDVIVDAIWAMANRRAKVDDGWLNRGAKIQMFDRSFHVLPVEELIWSKLYIVQRERCDWPDILNLIHATGPYLDWNHLLHRVAEDAPLLKGVLAMFSWISPEKAASIPPMVWRTLNLPFPEKGHDPEGRPARPDLLDSRPWFPDQIVPTAA